MSSCCHQPPEGPSSQKTPVSTKAIEKDTEKAASSCCATDAKAKFDWLLWGSLSLVTVFYLLFWLLDTQLLSPWSVSMGEAIFQLINTMWWSMALAAVFVGVLGRVPQSLVTGLLGKGGSLRGIWRATLAGVALDLCSHGILMVGMQLYKRGASLGQVMAFLIASPWNSLSLTLILVALIGLSWTLAFIALSMLIAVVAGYIFDRLVRRGVLPENHFSRELPENFHFWTEVKAQWREASITPSTLAEVLWEGIKGSRMVLRWLLFGVLVAALIRTFVSLDIFQQYFGPTLVGLGMTLIAATIIEVCSEGSTPIAADLMTRASAPGNSFAFLMAGVATDYTEVMSIKDTTSSWKIALFLPLLTLPQVIVVALLLNSF